MPDREKVIKGLEEAEIMLIQAVDRGGGMAVMGAFKCLNRVTDALSLLNDCDTQLQYRDDHIAMYQAEIKRLEALLKEQEAVEPLAIKQEMFDEYYGAVACCPNCDCLWIMYIDEDMHYCPECGQAVKWE